jgi:hypothetical protein
VTNNFQSYEIDPDTLPEYPALCFLRPSRPEAVGVIMCAATESLRLSWDDQLPSPTMFSDVVVLPDPPLCVITAIWVLEDVILDSLRVVLVDRTSPPFGEAEALAKQETVDVIVFDRSGRSVAMRRFPNFYNVDVHDAVTRTLPERVPLERERVKAIFECAGDVVTEDAALVRICEANGLQSLRWG